VERINAGLIEQEREEVSDWRQLFPFIDSTNSGDETLFSADIFHMEDEWRQMYWQETFGDGSGLWQCI
jgi:hypothetical protein